MFIINRSMALLAIIVFSVLLTSCRNTSSSMNSNSTDAFSVSPSYADDITRENATSLLSSSSSDSEAPPPPPGMPKGLDSFVVTEVPLRQSESLEDTLRKIQNDASFSLSTLKYVSGFAVDSVMFRKFYEHDLVEVILISKQKPAQTLIFRQAEADSGWIEMGECPPAPPEPTSLSDKCSIFLAEIQGVQSKVVALRNPITGFPEVRVTWNKDGIAYELIGQNYDTKGRAIIEKIANSVETLQ